MLFMRITGLCYVCVGSLCRVLCYELLNVTERTILTDYAILYTTFFYGAR